MNWYSQYKTSGKTWRDIKDHIILYHVSPNRLNYLSPRSKFYGYSGAYVSPSYKSIVNDWASYVMHKKHKFHPLDKKWDELIKRRSELEDVKTRSPEQEEELAQIEIKLDKVGKSLNKEEHIDATGKGYKTVYIHKLSCPMGVYKEAKEMFEKAQESGYRKDNWGFWGWGEQIFIPFNLLDQIKILSVEELNLSDFLDKYRDFTIGPYRGSILKEKKWNE